MHPIIIGIAAAGPGNDQIPDGAHRVVAAALAAASVGMVGPYPAPGISADAQQWKQFIPRFVAQSLN